MSLIKYNRRFPFFDQVFPEMLDTHGLFNENLVLEDNWIPAINIKEDDNNIDIEVAAPGFTKKDFEVSLLDNVLTIAANNNKSIEDSKKEYSRREFYYNTFKRSFTLPKVIDFNKKIKAKYDDGVLRVKLTKLHILNDEAQKKLIDIA